MTNGKCINHIKINTDINQYDISCDDFETDEPFFTKEVESEYGIGYVSETEDVKQQDGTILKKIVKVAQETLANISNRVAKEAMTFSNGVSYICATTMATLFRGATARCTALLRDGIANYNVGFSYNKNGLCKKNNILYISTHNRNKNNNIENNQHFKRGIMNTDLLPQRFNIWNVSIVNNIITLTSDGDFVDYKFRPDQLRTGLCLSFIAPNDCEGYIEGGYRLIIDGYETKLFENIDETKSCLQSNIKKNCLITIFFNQQGDEGYGAFYTQQSIISAEETNNIGNVIWKDYLLQNNDKYVRLNGQYLDLLDYSKFNIFIKNLLITNPDNFTDYNSWLSEQNNSYLYQTNHYCYESNHLYAYKYNDSIYYILYDLANVPNLRKILIYDLSKTYIYNRYGNEYGIWEGYESLQITDGIKREDFENGFIFSNFSKNRYITINQSVNATNDWEVCLSFTLNNLTENQTLFLLNHQPSYDTSFGCRGMIYGNTPYKINFEFSTEGTQPNITTIIAEHTESDINKQVWYKIGYNVNDHIYYVRYSFDGVNYETAGSYGATQTIFNPQQAVTIFGSNSSFFSSKCSVNIDTNCYIGDYKLLNKYIRDEESDVGNTMPLYAYQLNNNTVYTRSSILPATTEMVDIALRDKQGYLLKLEKCNCFGIWNTYNKFVDKQNIVETNTEHGISYSIDASAWWSQKNGLYRQFNLNNTPWWNNANSLDVTIGFRLTGNVTNANNRLFSMFQKNGKDNWPGVAFEYNLNGNNPYVGVYCSSLKQDSYFFRYQHYIYLELNKIYYYRLMTTKLDYNTTNYKVFYKSEDDNDFIEICTQNLNSTIGVSDNNIILLRRYDIYTDDSYQCDPNIELIFDENYCIKDNQTEQIIDDYKSYLRNPNEDILVPDTSCGVHLKNIVRVTGQHTDIDGELQTTTIKDGTGQDTIVDEGAKGYYYICVK